VNSAGSGRRSGATTTIHLTLTIPVETVMTTVAAIRQLEAEANRQPEVVERPLPTAEDRLHQRQRRAQATRTRATATIRANTTRTIPARAREKDETAR
jgi:hypothetical protein